MIVRRKRWIGAAGMLAMSAVMLTTMIGLWSRHAAHTAHAMGRQLEQLPADELLPHLRSMTRLGDAAMPELCAALDSPRDDVADTAAAVLREELARWELLPAQEAGKKLSLLARLLADQANTTLEGKPNPVARRHCVELATHILRSRPSGSEAMPQITAACHSILEAAAEEPAGPRLLTVSHARPISERSVEAMPVALELNEATIASPEPEATVAPKTAAHQEPVAVSPTPAAAQEPMPPALLEVDIRDARPIEAAGAAPAATTVTIKPAQTELRIASVTGQNVPLAQLNTIPVVQLLHSTDAAIAQAAREELLHRGHSPEAISLQQRLCDSNSDIRCRALEELPQAAEIDARGWLLALSRDESSAVRLVALTLMATSGESRMQRRVREMGASDADPTVRAQAQRIGR